MKLRADIITVYHNDTNYEQHRQLRESLVRHEPEGGFTFIGVDNRVTNRGFARGCNLGAFSKGAGAPVIGFINPDAVVTGPFLEEVAAALVRPVVITGRRFGKPQSELDLWGVSDWVCGAALFVERQWFTDVGGFDERYVWGWEETDLIRQAQRQGLTCRSIDLPIEHHSPTQNSPVDANFKRHHFERGARQFYSKWPQPAQSRGR